jgi:hypothetical protein
MLPRTPVGEKSAVRTTGRDRELDRGIEREGEEEGKSEKEKAKGEEEREREEKIKSMNFKKKGTTAFPEPCSQSCKYNSPAIRSLAYQRREGGIRANRKHDSSTWLQRSGLSLGRIINGEKRGEKEWTRQY